MISRRKFISITAAAAALGTAYFYGVHRSIHEGYTLKNTRTMMGTFVNFTIIGQDQVSCTEALQETVAHMEKVGHAINMYKPESPLAQLNREGKLENADPVLIKVITLAQEMAQLTNGAFDPTVLPLLALYKHVKAGGTLPSQEKINKALALVDFQKVEIAQRNIQFAIPGMGLTLDGIGKGYVVDEGVRIINDLGFDSVCIEAGGDLMVTGTKQDGSPWTIAIQNPRPGKNAKQFIVKMKNRAIATSGDYMQSFTDDRSSHHIINPATGFSPPELASCSILAPNVAMADGLATSAMVMGPDKTIELLETLPGCGGFLIGKDLSTYTTKDFFS